ncbi:MAG: lysozyme inhibitor LprI family protein [Chthoniobacteraceae bacterium]
MLTAVLALPLNLCAGDLFRRFPETTSPDGAWVFAWGTAQKDGADLAALKEAGEADHIGVDDEVDNFLVDAVSGRVVRKIPDFHYFSGPDGRQNHHGLKVAWSPDSRGALAIYDGRYNFDVIVWVDPTAPTFPSLGGQLAEALGRVVIEREGKKMARRAGDLLFSNPVITRPGTLVVDAEASSYSNKTADAVDFSYQMKFKITGTGKKMNVQLLKTRVPKDGENPAGQIEDEKLEDGLNNAYGRLRAKLGEAAREALKKEELTWLKLRDGQHEEDAKRDLTRRRLIELSARAEDW